MIKQSDIFSAINSYIKNILLSKDLLVICFIMAILFIIIVPLPAYLLDLFLTISISLSILIMLIGLYIAKPTDFSAFPTLLLMVTLFRIALNVATTRMILSNGYMGANGVSDIIFAFGHFVAGGNYIIGIIIFCILVLVNYIVITNGSTRVAEVQARFTLEAMPGKQMAIDADLNSGLIDKEEAQKRREVLVQEADFYGSMDGASKFVKGDAIAGIVITFINIIGGFLLGVFTYNLTIAESANIFTILTIGDGLVSQIPALIVSTATGIVITRATKNEDRDFASGIINQLLGNSKILGIVGVILLLFAMVPSLPSLSLGFIGSIFLCMSYFLSTEDNNNIFYWAKNWIFKKANIKDSNQRIKPQKPSNEVKSVKSIRELEEQIKLKEQANLNDKLQINILQIYLGYGLTKLAEFPNSPLIERIRGVRSSIAQTYGFIVPQIRIKANPSHDFSPNGYEILLRGVKIGYGEVMPDKLLAMNPNGGAIKDIEGIPTKEPTFGMDALWIDKKDKDDATIAGYTVVDSSSVISVHINEIIKTNAEEIITRQDVRNLIDRLADDFPSLIKDADNISLGVIHQVLQELLHDKIPIKDMLTILETIIEVAPKTQNNVPIIMDYVRSKLSRVITDTFKSEDDVLRIFTLSQDSEEFLLSKLKDASFGKRLVLSVGETQALIESIDSMLLKSKENNITPILLVETSLRRTLSKEMEKFNKHIVVLGYGEISNSIKCEFLGNLEIKF